MSCHWRAYFSAVSDPRTSPVRVRDFGTAKVRRHSAYPRADERSSPCTPTNPTIRRPFERTSKRRRGYPSEQQVKRGHRVVHGEVELVERLGRNDLCPCGSGRRFQALLPERGAVRRRGTRLLLSAIARDLTSQGRGGRAVPHALSTSPLVPTTVAPSRPAVGSRDDQGREVPLRLRSEPLARDPPRAPGACRRRGGSRRLGA
jgi:hypothetical protein